MCPSPWSSHPHHSFWREPQFPMQSLLPGLVFLGPIYPSGWQLPCLLASFLQDVTSLGKPFWVPRLDEIPITPPPLSTPIALVIMCSLPISSGSSVLLEARAGPSGPTVPDSALGQAGQELAALDCTCVCTQRSPPAAPLKRDTIQVVVLDPHKADPTMGQDGRQHPLLLLLHQDGHEVFHF